MKLFLLICIASGVLTACTTDAWRVGIQESAKQECLKAPIGEQERCLNKLKDSQQR
jgi:hypothetical protein